MIRELPDDLLNQDELRAHMKKMPGLLAKLDKAKQEAKEKKMRLAGGLAEQEEMEQRKIDEMSRKEGEGRRLRLAHICGLEMASRARREAHILSNLAHPNIISFIDAFQKDGKQFMFLEYVDGGDLEKEINKKARLNQCWNEESTLFFFVQIVLAVEYLHRHNILHRDLKTANVLMSKNLFLKLSDFGTSESYNNMIMWDTSEAVTKVGAGTPLYAAPELFRSEPYSEKADMYSLGVILYCLLEPGSYPHFANNVPELRAKVVNEQYRPLERALSEPVRHILHALLRKEPHRRPSALQILQTRVMLNAFSQYRRRVEKFLAPPPPPPSVSPASSPNVASPTSTTMSSPTATATVPAALTPAAAAELILLQRQFPAEVGSFQPPNGNANFPTRLDFVWFEVLKDQFELIQEYSNLERHRLRALQRQNQKKHRGELESGDNINSENSSHSAPATATSHSSHMSSTSQSSRREVERSRIALAKRRAERRHSSRSSSRNSGNNIIAVSPAVRHQRGVIDERRNSKRSGGISQNGGVGGSKNSINGSHNRVSNNNNMNHRRISKSGSRSRSNSNNSSGSSGKSVDCATKYSTNSTLQMVKTAAKAQNK